MQGKRSEGGLKGQNSEGNHSHNASGIYEGASIDIACYRLTDLQGHTEEMYDILQDDGNK